MYTSAYCTYCRRAKRLLERKQVDYEEVRLDEDAEKRKELVERLNWKTVPMIFVNEQFIGGYDDLSALERSGELDRMLGQSNS
jgi:glutaredoxin 3